VFLNQKVFLNQNVFLGQTVFLGGDIRFANAKLLFLLVVERVLAEPGGIFLQLQLLTARFATQRVVLIPCLGAHEMNHFESLFTLGHDLILP
jgi:hypothetical protein